MEDEQTEELGEKREGKEEMKKMHSKLKVDFKIKLCVLIKNRAVLGNQSTCIELFGMKSETHCNVLRITFTIDVHAFLQFTKPLKCVTENNNGNHTRNINKISWTTRFSK